MLGDVFVGVTILWALIGSHSAQHELYEHYITGQGALSWEPERALYWLEHSVINSQLTNPEYCGRLLEAGLLSWDYATTHPEVIRAGRYFARAAMCSCGCELEANSLTPRTHLTLACSRSLPPLPPTDLEARSFPLPLPKLQRANHAYVCNKATQMAARISLHNTSDVSTALGALQIAAYRGSAQASFDLAVLLSKDYTPPKDHPNAPRLKARPDVARRMFQRAAALGHTDAMFNVAVDAQRIGDWPTARTWYARAALQGDGEAMVVLGNALSDSEVLPADLPTAASLLSCAMLLGNENAKPILSAMARRYGRNLVKQYVTPQFCQHIFGSDASINRTKAPNAMVVSSAFPLQTAVSQFPSTIISSQTMTREQNRLQQAEKLLDNGQAAEAYFLWDEIVKDGSLSLSVRIDACLHIARLCRKGASGFPPQPALALPTLEIALQLYGAEATHEIALILEDLKQDEAALAMYHIGAGMSVNDAIFNLGHVYYHGSSLVQPNETISDEYFARAAECGDAEAMYLTALRLMEKPFGTDKTQNDQEATLDVDNEDERSINPLVKAHVFLNVAFSRGVTCAQQELLRIERILEPELLVEAHVMARQWGKRTRCSVSEEDVKEGCAKALEIMRRIDVPPLQSPRKVARIPF